MNYTQLIIIWILISSLIQIFIVLYYDKHHEEVNNKLAKLLHIHNS